MKKSRYTEEQIAYVLRQAEAGRDVCRSVGISEATFYVWKKKYASLGVTELRKLRQLEAENVRLKRLVADLTLDKHILQEVIAKIAMSRPRFGYQRIHVVLRREGWKVNRKRVHRLYRLEGLQVRMRVRRRKRMSLHRGPAPRPTALGERWSMDFVHDQLANGRAFRVLTVVDNWSRESVVLETGFRLTGESVAHALARASERRALPRSITVDHGTEFTSRALDQWAWENGVQLDFTRPGKPTDNGLCFNGRLRDECLNVNEFESIDHAREKIEAWRIDYNEQRPHGAFGYLTPSEYADSGRESTLGGAEL